MVNSCFGKGGKGKEKEEKEEKAEQNKREATEKRGIYEDIQEMVLLLF